MTIFPGEAIRGKYSPLIVTVIILLNVLIYLYTSYSSYSPLLQTSDQSIMDYGFKPIYIFTDSVNAFIKMFTSMFVHADLFHIFFNMYFLWLFGSRVEGIIGHNRIVVLYLLSGLSAILFHVAFVPIGGYESLTIPAVGASGAISGVLGAYILMLPHTKLVMCTYFFLFPYCFRLSASTYLLLWFAEQVFYGYMRLGGVAYFAHIGGFVMGMALVPLLVRGVKREPEHMSSIYKYFQELYGIYISKPKGLGRGAKLIIVGLLLAIIGGFANGVLTSLNSSIYTMSIHLTNIKEGGRPLEVDQNEQLALVITSEETSFSTSYYSYVRIFSSRILPIVYNPGYSGREISGNMNYNVEIVNINVPVHLTVSAQFDERGVMIRSKGTMSSIIVLLDQYGRASVGSAISMDFTTISRRVSESLLAGLCILAMAVCVLALPAVLMADKVAFPSTMPPSLEFPYL